jgi:hypothetical protein
MLNKKGREMNFLQVKSCDNIVYLFTKSLSSAKLQKYVNAIGIQ